MNVNAKKELKEKMRLMITTLQNEVKVLENHTQPIAPENSIGRISRMDAINNKSVAEANLRYRKRKLAKMQVAISKVHNDNFGICSRCKKKINPQRLILMPESDRCVNCSGRN